eukprot:CAMPEP_0114244348 /NCGR_PEP_ID=MMETSP0058-20121206/11286_1 /TAXON_ID=36894 /ORGANISM="Pyramimonas parkeae, CCMP726" /LENGTH=104 /DNA_ID=CAMNT_0001357271 /DNA_START=378 /DNA_END=692 /DNA_ORIENTATION=+
MVVVGELDGEAEGETEGQAEPRFVPEVAPDEHQPPSSMVTFAGMSPHNPAFVHTTNVLRWVSAASSLGIDPDRRLPNMRRYVRLVSLPSSVGMVPVSRLSRRHR